MNASWFLVSIVSPSPKGNLRRSRVGRRWQHKLSPKLIHSTHLEILQAAEYSLATRVTLHEMYKHLFFSVGKIFQQVFSLVDYNMLFSSKSCLTFCNSLLCPWDLPGRNTGVDCHSLHQGIFLTRDWTCVSCIGRHILYHWAT